MQLYKAKLIKNTHTFSKSAFKQEELKKSLDEVKEPGFYLWFVTPK